MQAVKHWLTLAIAGAIAGVVIATLIAPGFIAWYNTPGGTAQALCNCVDIVRQTTAQLIRGQLIGAGAGAAAFVLGAIVVRFLGRERKKPEAGETPLPADSRERG